MSDPNSNGLNTSYAMVELSFLSSCVSVSEVMESVKKCKVTAWKGGGGSLINQSEFCNAYNIR
jgi:hypothetical protein